MLRLIFRLLSARNLRRTAKRIDRAFDDDGGYEAASFQPPKAGKFEYEFTAKVNGRPAGNWAQAWFKVADHLDRVPDRMANIAEKEFRRFLVEVADEMGRRHDGPWPGGTTRKTLSKRSGKGVQSIAKSVRTVGGKLRDVEGRIGAPGYMAIHERGGVIKARSGKMLAIPLPAALNSNGTPKLKSPREWSNTFVGQSRKGNVLIFQRRGRKIVPLYALKPSVRIPPRLGLGETIVSGLPTVAARMTDRIAAEFHID